MEDEWDLELEQMFADLVAEGEFEVSKRDAAGKPIAWRMTDARKAELMRKVKLMRQQRKLQ
jgi:hypothetical protein